MKNMYEDELGKSVKVVRSIKLLIDQNVTFKIFPLYYKPIDSYFKYR